MTAFLHAIGTVVAGTYATARLSLTVPQSLVLSGARGRWELIDADGRTWNQGEFDELTSEASQTAPGQQTISATVQVAVPSSLPANNSGTSYQLRWTLYTSAQPLYSFENFTVLPATQQLLGSRDAVEMLGDNAAFQIVLPEEYSHVEFELYKGNGRLTENRSATPLGNTAAGYVFAGKVGPDVLTSGGLDPYSVSWSYWNEGTLKQRESSQLFVVTNIILDAVRDFQSQINRAYQSSGIQPDTNMDVIDYVKYLRQGRDHFNAADKPTEFTMTAVQGPMRWFWIGYSCVALARAQYMAEGMKAFDFQGSTVQLNVDKTPFWDAYASQLESQLNEQVKPFKDNLVKKGILGGDGSSMALRPGAVGSIGVAIHGLSPVRGIYGMGSPFSPFQR